MEDKYKTNTNFANKGKTPNNEVKILNYQPVGQIVNKHA